MQDGAGRRLFLKTVGACVLNGAAAGMLATSAAKAVALESDVAGAKMPRLLSGCSAFSFRKQLTIGQMTMEDFIRRAVDLHLDGVDMTLYYLKSTDPGYLESLRYLAYKNAVTFTGAACGSRTAQSDAAKRAEAVNDIKKWVDVTAALGAPQLRVFAGALPSGVPLEQAIDWVVETMKAAVDYSAKKGITLSIENNRGVSQSADACLEVMRRVDSPYVGITLDITHFVATPSQDAYAQIAACIPYATNAHILDRFDDGTSIDLDRVWNLFAQGGFRGYMSLEYDHTPNAQDTSSTDIPRLIAEIRRLCAKYSSTAA